MEFTGERYCPGIKGEIALEHYLRYALAARLAKGREVLDIASGEGYGSALLAKTAKKVIGVDVSPQAIENAMTVYNAPNLEFILGDAARIPLPDDSVDMVTSFETIEHHDRQEEMMAELRRVLRPDGLLMLSSPDRAMNEDLVGHNPFHVRELYKDELAGLAGRHFKRYSICGQRTIFASVVDGTENVPPMIWPQDECQNPGAATNAIPDPRYFILLATDCDEIPGIPPSIMEGAIRDAEAFVHAQMHISNLENDLARVRDELGITSESLQKSIRAHNEALAECEQLAGEITRLDTEASRLAAELENARHENLAMNEELHNRQIIIDVMRNSRSWRITAPIRYVFQKCREARLRLFSSSTENSPGKTEKIE